MANPFWWKKPCQPTVLTLPTITPKIGSSRPIKIIYITYYINNKYTEYGSL